MSGLSGQTKARFRTLINSVRTRLLADLAAACDARYSLAVRNRGTLRLDARTALQYDTLAAWLADPARVHDKSERNLEALVCERAYTLVNRLVILLQLEQRGLRKVQLISQWPAKSAFQTERGFFYALTEGEDQGMAWVLQQVFDQLALELPALFAWDEVQECVPVPGTTLLWLLEQLGDPELAEAWRDDTTLGWLYQFWNDPDKQAVDKKLKGDGVAKGPVETHEIGFKTQLFTDHYMVEWLLNNSLGDLWRAVCRKNGWTEKENLVLSWKGYGNRDLAPGFIEDAPDRLEDVRILDPAMGSGHFLVHAFTLLYGLYRAQREVEGKEFSPAEVVDLILSRNLHGIDISSRAVQIAAAALHIKAREYAPDVHLSAMQIVATDLGLRRLAPDDPAFAKLRAILQAEFGLSDKFVRNLVENLRYADALGSLTTITREIREALAGTGQRDLVFEKASVRGVAATDEELEEAVYATLEEFIKNHDSDEDLGVSGLAGQLSRGLRLINLLRKQYHLVCANPPYLDTSSIEKNVSEKLEAYSAVAKGDLYALFFICLENMTCRNGLWCVVAQHNWMFLGSLKEFRKHILTDNAVVQCAHLGTGAFEAISGEVVGSAMFVMRRSRPAAEESGSYARLVNAAGYDERVAWVAGTPQEHTYAFPQSRFAEIPGSPMIYWWPEEFRQAYLQAKKLGEVGEVLDGMTTASNERFTRSIWETNSKSVYLENETNATYNTFPETHKWASYIMGAKNKRWFESTSNIVNWKNNGKEIRNFRSFPRSMPKFFRRGISFNKIGTSGFLCRLPKYCSIFDVAASTIFTKKPNEMQVLLSSSISSYVSQSMNPTVNNTTGVITNLPVFGFALLNKQHYQKAEALYDRLFASTESNLEYAYEHLDPETFEVEEARIRDEIDKEILAHFSRETAAALYREIGESVFDFPAWDGKPTSIPADFAAAYQESASVEGLCRRYRLHPDSILALKGALGLVHAAQAADEVFKHLSWAIGVLVGRFDAQTGGLVDLAAERLATIKQKPDLKAPKGHKHGLLYLSALDGHDGLECKLDTNSGPVGLETLRSILAYKHGEAEAARIWERVQTVLVLEGRSDWKPTQRDKRNLGWWLREEAFARHLALYDNRPIYFPLVSTKKNFFAWVNIHAWSDNTLSALLANYLKPDYAVLESRVRRLREERSSVKEARKQNALEDEIDWLDTLREELAAFITLVTQLAERGPDPALQEVEAPFVMDLDDGVMVNSAALYELVLPLWKKPKEWWKSLSAPVGKKDFDWSHLAMRYWPARVLAKVRKDPSLAVAHSDYGAYQGRDLFEELHPAAAEKWRKQQGKTTDDVPNNQQELEL